MFHPLFPVYTLPCHRVTGNARFISTLTFHAQASRREGSAGAARQPSSVIHVSIPLEVSSSNLTSSLCIPVIVQHLPMSTNVFPDEIELFSYVTPMII